MFNAIGRTEERSPFRLPNPPANTQHPREGSFKARYEGRGLGGHQIAVQIFVPRKTVCGLRDKMACASSSAKRSRFVMSNGHVDRVVDEPTVNLTPPRPRRRRRR